MWAGSDMSEELPCSGVATVLARFPRDAETVWRLVRDSAEFGELCDHLALARETLSAFEQRPDAQGRPEIVEYRSLVSELEKDVARMIVEARTADRTA
jgi:hypothetical protein